MSDPQWQDVLLSARSAARHFEAADRILARDDFDDRGETGYVNAMAFFHAMQSGHTALEDALLRILLIIGEEEPTGESWHADLIRLCSSRTADRPPILSEAVAIAAQQTRGFRHRATHATVRFEVAFNKERAQVAASAGKRIAAELEPTMLAFINIIDPT